MSVQEQMPIVVYVANGNTSRFAITFDLHDQNYLVVTLNNEVAQVGSYSVLDGEVVFGTAPADGSLVTLYRDTQLNRTTNYKGYDNSFRPESINWDFDKLWHVLQEQNLIDGKILARIRDEIEWRRTHDFNYDELAQVREKQLFDALKGYADTLYSATNPNVFAGVIAGVVFARDGKSIQAHIEEILDNLAVSREDIDSKAGQQYVDEQLNLKPNSSDVYLKSQTYNKSETYSNTEVDTKFSAYVGGRKAYTTLALAQADQVNLPANTAIEVTNDGANNGTYQWNGTTLTKSDYDQLTQAKNYFDTNVGITNEVELYKQSNNVSNRNIDPANGSLRFVLNTQVSVFPITAGETYTLNSVNFVDQYAVLAVSPNSDTTVGKTQTLVSLTSIDTETRIFVAPITGFAFLNVKWGTPLDITATLTIKSTEFDAVVKIKDTNIRDELAQQRLNDAGIETVLNEADLSIVYPNIYDISEKTSGFFVGTAGTLTSNAGGELVAIPISPGHTYLIKSPQYLSSKIVGLSADSTVSNGKPITLRNLSATNEADVFQFTVAEDDVFQFAFFTTRLDSQSYDVRSTVEIYEDSITDNKAPYISKISGYRLGASSQAEKPLSRLTDKKVFALGDSITQGTEGGYIKYLEAAFGTMINNYGSSGGRASRVVDIVTAGEGLPKRDSATEATVWPTKNFTDLACVTLMIGTNDSDANITLMGSIDQLPTGKVQDYATSNEYWALFPNNYVCNIALTIEFIRWKAPKAEIHICTPPYRNQTGVSDETRITKLIPLLESVCRHYAVHLFYGTYECGIGYKEMSGELNVYSYDGVHFTELGNEVFGKFFAQKVLSFE